MGGFYTPASNLGRVRVVAFSGRESDAPYGVWGAIAAQLGRRDQFKDYYAPLSAPGQTARVNLRDRLLLTTANHGCRSQGNPAGR